MPGTPLPKLRLSRETVRRLTAPTPVAWGTMGCDTQLCMSDRASCVEHTAAGRA